MADQPQGGSILAAHVHERGMYGTAAAEVAAMALDISAMMARVVSILDELAKVPAVAQSDQGPLIRELLGPLKVRNEAHMAAMEKLNRG